MSNDARADRSTRESTEITERDSLFFPPRVLRGGFLKPQVWFACVCVGALACLTSAQTLDERLDEEQFLRGLDDLRLPEVLEHYIASHPTNEPVRLGQFEIARQRMILN